MNNAKRNSFSLPRGLYLRRRYFAGALALAGLLLTPGCHEQKSESVLPSNVIATVGGQFIPLEAFQRELSRRAMLASGQAADPAAKKAVLEEMIRFEVLHHKALAAGYDKDPQVAASLKRMLVAKFQEDQAAKAGQIQLTPADLADYYQNNLQRFGTPKKVRAALIEINVPRTATAEKRAEVAKKAEAILAEAKAVGGTAPHFGMVAQKYSEHQPSRYRGGDIGWLTAGVTNTDWPPAVLSTIFKLSQAGEFGPVVETPGGFFLVRLIEIQPAKVQPLEEVKDGVQYLAARQKEQQQKESFYVTMKQGVKIQINQALLETVPVPVKEMRPPGLPGGPGPVTRKAAGDSATSTRQGGE